MIKVQVTSLATPKGPASAEAGATPMPNTAMSNLAADAREKLHSRFTTTPAGPTAPPQLPPVPVQRQPHENVNRLQT